MTDPNSVHRQYWVRLADGREFGPGDSATIAQWAREGRVPHNSMIVERGGTDPEQAIAASEHPSLRSLFNAPPVQPGPVMPPQPDGISVLIPYRNGPALGAYYVGVFSLVPMFAIVLGPLAIVLGVVGLKQAARRPEAKGRVHAWIGIVLGSMTILFHVGVIAVLLIAATK